MGLHFHLRSADRQHIAPEAMTSISALSRGNKEKKRLMSDQNIVWKPEPYPEKDTDVPGWWGCLESEVNRVLAISDRLGVAVAVSNMAMIL